jgi:DNA polymerase iota
LLHGCDDTEVSQAREVPKQISIEDSYRRLDTIEDVIGEFRILARSLIKRMRVDLVQDEEQGEIQDGPEHSLVHQADAQRPLSEVDSLSGARGKRWMAYPRTLRLSTRPRPPQNPDGSRNRSFARISRSSPMPNFVFNLEGTIETLVERLITEALMPLFKRLHPEKSGWNLSLVNLAATNMVDTASDKGGVGRDITKMFERQVQVLRPFKVADIEEQADVDLRDRTIPSRPKSDHEGGRDVRQPLKDFIWNREGSEDIPTQSQELAEDMDWQSEEEGTMAEDCYQCEVCDAVMPVFAMLAHSRWHNHG